MNDWTRPRSVDLDDFWTSPGQKKGLLVLRLEGDSDSRFIDINKLHGQSG